MAAEHGAEGAAPDGGGLFASAVARRAVSPGFKHAAQSKDLAILGKPSPLEAVAPAAAPAADAAPRAAEASAQAVRQRLAHVHQERGPAAASPATARPITGMSLRERAYLKSSMGRRHGEPAAASAARPPLPKVMPIPPLNLRVAVGLMGDQNAGRGKNPNAVPKARPGAGQKQPALQLPPRPASVLEGAHHAERADALRVDRPHSVAGTVRSAGSPVPGAMLPGHGSSGSRAHTAASRDTASSRASTALEPLRLNTAELIRQNEVLRQENEELRQLMVADASDWHQHARSRGGTAASRRSGTLTALSNRSTLSSSWTNRSGLQKPADDALTGRSNLSTANSIRYFQGDETPAEDRIEALKAEIFHHQHQEEQLKAALLQAANTLPTHAKEQADRRPSAKASGSNSQIQSRASTSAAKSPYVRSPLALPSLHAAEADAEDRGGALGSGQTSAGRTPLVASSRTQPSERASLKSSLPRTAGNLTPYPREGTTSSNAAVIGQQLTTIAEGLDQPTESGSEGLNASRLASLTNSPFSLRGAPLTTAGPHAITVKNGENEWVAHGLKLDPRTSTVAMSLSARLTYPNKRLQTKGAGGGGSYAYAAMGRGPIMVEHAIPLSDGLMVRSPNDSMSDGRITSEQAGATGGSSLSTSSVSKRKLKGDATANCWHATNVTSALRWEARTRKFFSPLSHSGRVLPQVPRCLRSIVACHCS